MSDLTVAGAGTDLRAKTPIAADINAIPHARDLTSAVRPSCQTDFSTVHGWSSKNPLRVATMAHLRGSIRLPCFHCWKGDGPFNDCVTLQFGSGKWFLQGSCTNCGSGNQGRRCSHRKSFRFGPDRC
jgi:hypothetical protein